MAHWVRWFSYRKVVIFQSVSDAYDGWLNTKPEQRRMGFASASHMTLKSAKNTWRETLDRAQVDLTKKKRDLNPQTYLLFPSIVGLLIISHHRQYSQRQVIYIYIYYYVISLLYSIWLVVEPNPLKNMKVTWDDDIPNIWKVIKFHGSKPPSRFSSG